ncbi:hypothetical protein [Sphingomonas sp. Leaf4]|uniref:hypothetical protein n=1 Tax=Sphingomonas sp. Leaf4 TaxID=2876553 RepID=UPI001E53058D|nr:hypothetical protein [Sphingomonas sp. Leaf4]
MKPTPPMSAAREHPHLIHKGVRGNRRSAIVVSNGPVGRQSTARSLVFEGRGLLDAHGGITPHGRDAILARLSHLARTSKASYCVVWSATECTWFERDGRTRNGCVPPYGHVSDPWIGRDHDVRIEHCWTITLPQGSEWSHICVRRIDRDLVEISPGEPVVLADFDEPEVPGLPDPAADMLAPDGSLVAPRTYRGQPVTGIRDQWKLLGPVQPAEDGVILRNPWPDDVREACERIAGGPLPRRLVDAAWRAIDPEHPEVTYVGVLKAA